MKTPLLNRLLQCNLLLLLLISATNAQAQVPQYRKARVGGSIVPNVGCYFRPAMDTSPRRIQMIFEPGKHFPKAPRGHMKAIYLRVGAYNNVSQLQKPGYTYNLNFSLGYTQKDTFRKLAFGNPLVRDTFVTGLTPVATLPVLRQNIKDSPWAWFRIPLTSPFLYDSSQEQNLVVDITFGPNWMQDYFCLGDSANGGTQQRMGGFRDTPWVYESAIAYMGVGNSTDFGFDMSPVGVEAGAFNGGSFTLLPNPSKGTFRINIDRAAPIREVTIVVYDILGQRVLQRQFRPDRANFMEELSITQSVRGWYVVEVIADGERVVRRLLVE